MLNGVKQSLTSCSNTTILVVSRFAVTERLTKPATRTLANPQQKSEHRCVPSAGVRKPFVTVVVKSTGKTKRSSGYAVKTVWQSGLTTRKPVFSRR